ncbi:hypothetical protein F4859DRAFT_279642 [Xylaria cf. heliscus]|nr:hypothetical protein F4859DRAFT_279642 [Xylaria cf. heliscus]
MSAEDSYVPTEQIMVVRCGEKYIKHTKRPNAKGWFVKKDDPHQPYSLRILPEIYEVFCQTYPGIPIEERQGAFSRGHEMVNLATSIHTCGTRTRRPKVLYRLVHDKQPYDGKKPRGHGRVKVDPISFHILFIRHLKWRCRNASPFLSATDSLTTITQFYDYYKRGHNQNIKIIKFRTYGKGWDHKKQRLYHVPTLLSTLGGVSARKQKWMDNEYIIEGEIPEESIIEERPLKPGNPRNVKKFKKPSTARDDEGEKVVRTSAYKYHA